MQNNIARLPLGNYPLVAVVYSLVYTYRMLQKQPTFSAKKCFAYFCARVLPDTTPLQDVKTPNNVPFVFLICTYACTNKHFHVLSIYIYILLSMMDLGTVRSVVPCVRCTMLCDHTEVGLG